MGIILNGTDDLFSDLQTLMDRTKDKDKRSLGYLLFELANLSNFDQVRERLKFLKEKRKDLIDFPGLKEKPTPPPLEPKRFEEIITDLIDNIDNKYENEIKSKKNLYNTPFWNLPASPEDQADLFKLFRFHLKKTAEQCIADAGE